MATHARIGAALAAARGFLGENPERRSLLRVGAYLVSTRVILWVVVWSAVRMRHPHLHPSALRELGPGSAIVGWLRWDVWWYVSIVEQGYSFDPRNASNVAFWPGLPVLVALLRPVLGSAAIAGLVVANASFVAAVLVVWSWVRERAGPVAAERAAIWLLLYPLSFFFNTVYAEGLFFLLCTLALRSADRGQWRAAGLHACLATLTRPMGLFLVPAFAWALARARRAGRLPRDAAFATVAPLVGFGSYAVYTWVSLGSPIAMWTAQRVGWGVGQHWSLPQLRHRTDVYREVLDVFQMLLPILLIMLSARAWRRFGVISGVYAALAAAVGIGLGGDSVGREALAVVPAFAAAGLTSFGPFATAALRSAAFALLVTFVYAFATGHFMG